MSDQYLAGVVWRLLNTTEANKTAAREPDARTRRMHRWALSIRHLLGLKR